LTEKIGRTGDAISQLERCLSLPSFETLDRLADTLDGSIRDFFDGNRAEEGSAQRRKLLTEVIDMARRMTDKELQLAAQVLEAVASRRTRSNGKA
jgi:transcriptional regulator with XRE-family HTH domain